MAVRHGCQHVIHSLSLGRRFVADFSVRKRRNYPRQLTSSRPLPDGYLVTAEHMILSLNVELTARDPSVRFGPLAPEFLNTPTFLNGRPIVLAAHLNQHAEIAIEEERRARARQFSLVGDHNVKITPGMIYEPGELLVGEIDIARIMQPLQFGSSIIGAWGTVRYGTRFECRETRLDNNPVNGAARRRRRPKAT